jgi:hypothetical protein
MRLPSVGTRLLATGCAIAAGTVLLAACGSKSDDGGKRLSQTAYISQADAQCTAVNKLPQAKPANDAKAAAANANREAGIRKSLVDKLSKLQPPKSLDGTVTAYLGQTDAVITLYRKQAKDAPNFQQYLRDQFGIDELTARREKTALQVGYRVCGRPPNVDGSKFDANLIGQADAACRPPNEAALKATGAKPYGLDDLAVIAKGYDASLPVAQASVAKLKALTPKAAAKSDYDAFLKSYVARVAITEQQSKAAHAKDKKAFTTAGNADGKEQQKESGLALQLGFESCGNHGTAGV